MACVVFFDKKWTGLEFINFIKQEFNRGALKDANVELWIADDEGDIDDDYPQPEEDQILSKMGLTYFYLKINDVDTQARKTMATDVRQNMEHMYVLFEWF